MKSEEQTGAALRVDSEENPEENSEENPAENLEENPAPRERVDPPDREHIEITSDEEERMEVDGALANISQGTGGAGKQVTSAVSEFFIRRSGR